MKRDQFYHWLVGGIVFAVVLIVGQVGLQSYKATGNGTKNANLILILLGVGGGGSAVLASMRTAPASPCSAQPLSPPSPQKLLELMGNNLGEQALTIGLAKVALGEADIEQVIDLHRRATGGEADLELRADIDSRPVISTPPPAYNPPQVALMQVPPPASPASRPSPGLSSSPAAAPESDDFEPTNPPDLWVEDEPDEFYIGGVRL